MSDVCIYMVAILCHARILICTYYLMLGADAFGSSNLKYYIIHVDTVL